MHQPRPREILRIQEVPASEIRPADFLVLIHGAGVNHVGLAL
jgi:NADPH:quinone reductase-like Zn-dependent oxidoreductase